MAAGGSKTLAPLAGGSKTLAAMEMGCVGAEREHGHRERGPGVWRGGVGVGRGSVDGGGAARGKKWVA